MLKDIPDFTGYKADEYGNMKRNNKDQFCHK